MTLHFATLDQLLSQAECNAEAWSALQPDLRKMRKKERSQDALEQLDRDFVDVFAPDRFDQEQ